MLPFNDKNLNFVNDWWHEYIISLSWRLLNRPVTSKLFLDGSRPTKCPRVAMGKGMKGLRGYVKPQDTPFAPGYTNVHPPVRLATIGAWQRARRATRGWILQWGFSTSMFVRYISVIARDERAVHEVLSIWSPQLALSAKFRISWPRSRCEYLL